MDLIYLKNLRIDTTIGLYDWERSTKQVITLDLEIGTDLRPAGASDKIEDTLNYRDVAERLIRFASEHEFQLLEKLAEAISDVLLSEFKISWLRLVVNKQGALRGVRDVGVVIERGEMC